MSLKYPRILLLATIALLAACTSTPSTSQGTRAAQAPGRKQVIRTTLKNGLRVIVVHDALAPVATQQLTYFVGGNEAPKGFPGMAHAQEHMMFRGSPGLSGDQLAGIYARLGGDMDAFTTNNITSYFFTVPSDDIDLTLRIGAIRMRGVDDTEASWKKERGAIEQEVARDHSQPFYRLYERLLARMFAGTPYEYDALGTKASFDKTTGAMLKQFHETWYAPNNALLVVAGDVDPQAVIARVKKLYGGIPRRKLPAKPAIHLKPVQAATYRTKTDEPYGLVIVGVRMPGYGNPDYPAAELAASALGSQRGPIAALRYEGKALAAGFQMQAMPGTGLGFAYAVFPPGADVKAVRRNLVKAIESVRTKGVAPDLVTAVKRRALLKQALQGNSVSGLANAWTQAVAVAGLESPAQSIRSLRAVHVKQVNAYIAHALDLQHAVTLILSPTPGAQPKQGKGFGGAESFGSKPTQPVALPAWARKALARLPQPKPFMRPSDTRLPNGLRLIVQPMPGRHSISLYGDINQNEDLQAPKGEEGIADVLDSLFDWGPEGMTRLQFEAAQDKLGVDMSVGSSFSLKALPQNFDQGLKLLARTELEPALPSRAFRIEQRIQARSVQGMLQSPKFKFQQAIAEALFPAGDPMLRHATAKSVMGLSRTKLKAYYARTYRPDETTIVVMGDITSTRAKHLIKKYFGHWKAPGARPDLNYPPVPLSRAHNVLVPDPVRSQNRVVMAETLSLDFTNPDHFALDLANDLLGGGFYASPLYRVLREQNGLVYTLGSSFGFSRHRGRYSLSFGAYPNKVGKARQLAIQVLDNAISKPMSPAQLHLAKSIGLRQIELSGQSVSGIANGWINRSEEGLPLDWNYVMAHHFERLTAPQIQKVLKKYLDTTRLSVIQLGRKP